MANGLQFDGWFKLYLGTQALRPSQSLVAFCDYLRLVRLCLGRKGFSMTVTVTLFTSRFSTLRSQFSTDHYRNRFDASSHFSTFNSTFSIIHKVYSIYTGLLYMDLYIDV